jgi:hypothetical protein
MTTAELEIRLSRPLQAAASTFEIRLRFQAAGSAAWLESNPAQIDLTPADFDSDVLRADTEEYGRELTKRLFADDGARTFFEKAGAAAEMTEGSALRVRLTIAPDSPELHGLRWELLCDPWSRKPLVLGERVWFSRHLNSQDWTPVVLRSKEQLTALIVVANPIADGKKYPALALIDGPAEIDRARSNLAKGGIEPKVVQGPETLVQLQDHLHEEFDVLYLVCHGQLAAGTGIRESALWLEGHEQPGTGRGEAQRVLGQELVDLMSGLLRRPRLVVLASCQSANDETAPLGDGAPLAALGPRLAQAGIPAVLAMQGKVPMPTVATFIPAFFRELVRDGRIDRAVGAARSAVTQAKCRDPWMPVLFSRLENNALWSSGFASPHDAKGFEAWEALLDAIDGGSFTPVLGPGLLKDVFGTARQIAREWSRRDAKNPFPLADYCCNDLSQVNQFFSRRVGPKKPYDLLRQYQFDRIRSRFLKQLPPVYQSTTLNQFDQLLSAVGQSRRESSVSEPHRILAALPVPLFLTANPDDLLSEALAETGAPPKQPVRGLCPWNSHVKTPAELVTSQPTEQQPLVYHLMGRMSDHRTIVMTEDDYIQYLIGMAQSRNDVPGVVRLAVSETMLVFLGFQVEHWTFRALLRGLLALTSQPLSYRPVAVQVDPEANDFVDVERARQYLSEAFPVGNQSVQVYWGSAGDFLVQLAEHRSRRQLAKQASK